MYHKDHIVKVISIIFLVYLFINLSIGTYFEKYEPILNELTIAEFTDYVNFEFFISSWFYLFPTFSFVNKIFNSQNGYAIVVTVINIFAFSFVFNSLIKIFKSYKYSFFNNALYVLICFIILSENILYIQNPRTSFLCILAASLFVFSKANEKYSFKDYFLLISLSLLGILARLEIGFLLSICLLVFSLLFLPALRKFSVVLFFASLSFYSFYLFNQHFNHHDQEIALEVEHVFEDRGVFNSVSGYDFKTQLKLNGIRQYLRDDPNYSLKDIEGFVTKESFKSYLLSDRFPGIYYGKLIELFSLLVPYAWYIVFSLVLFIYTLYFINNKFKVLLMFLFMISYILFLNIFIIIPHNFILCLFYGLNIISLISLLSFKPNVKFIAGFLLCISGVTIWHFISVVKFEMQRNTNAEGYRAVIKELDANKKIIVLAHGLNEDNFPSRLFSAINDQHINYYCADFFLGRYPFFFNHNVKLFGDSFTGLGQKLDFMASNSDIVFLSDSSYNAFLVEYMYVLEGKKFSFEPIPLKVSSNSVTPYKVKSLH